MINYAWSNPATGLSEQAPTTETARQRVWEELEPVRQQNGSWDEQLGVVSVWKQEPIGEVDGALRPGNGPSSRHRNDLDPWDGGYGYAWETPSVFPAGYAARCIAETWELAVKRIQIQRKNMSGPPVIVYRQTLAFQVRWDDPNPFVETTATEPPGPTPESLLRELQDEPIDDPEERRVRNGYMRTLAFLWIAQALQKLANRPADPDDERRTRLLERLRDIKERNAEPNDENCARLKDALHAENCARIVRENELHGFRGHPGRDCEICGLPDRCTIHLGPHGEDLRMGQKPHVFTFSRVRNRCSECGQPEEHAIHGYTGY